MSSVYFIRCTASGLIKIGLSENPWKRLSKMQSDSPGQLEMLGVVGGDIVTEAELHDRFSASRLRGEWFNPTDDLVAFVQDLPAPVGERRKTYDPATSPTRLAAAVGIGKGHASNILSGKRDPGFDLALRIFAVTGQKFGDLARLTDADAETVRAIFGKQPARCVQIADGR